MNHLEKRIKEMYPLEDISVIKYTLMTEPATVKCNKCNAEYTLKEAQNFLRKGKRCICKNCVNDKSGGRFSLQDFQNEIDSRYPNENLEVLNYTTMRNPSSIKCKTCGTIYNLSHAESFVAKDKNRVCSKCLPNKRNQMQKTIDRFNLWKQNQDKYIFEELPPQIRSHTLIQATCKVCGAKAQKTIYKYLENSGCTYCQHNYLKTKEEYQEEIGEEYTILEYNGMNHRSKFKHNICGFIYEANSRGYGCPRCKGSKGEKRIRYYLLDSGIQFEEQKIFNIQGHLLRVDFYLPIVDLVIEYQGEQHFHPIDYFGGEATFNRQCEYDNLKRKYFKEKMIEISYTDFDKIKDILDSLNLRSSSTISEESKETDIVVS